MKNRICFVFFFGCVCVCLFFFLVCSIETKHKHKNSKREKKKRRVFLVFCFNRFSTLFSIVPCSWTAFVYFIFFIYRAFFFIRLKFRFCCCYLFGSAFPLFLWVLDTIRFSFTKLHLTEKEHN